MPKDEVLQKLTLSLPPCIVFITLPSCFSEFAVNQGTELQQNKMNHTKNNILLPEELPEATH